MLMFVIFRFSIESKRDTVTLNSSFDSTIWASTFVVPAVDISCLREFDDMSERHTDEKV